MLVVEDDPAVRLLVLDVLGMLGYRAIEAAEPRAAARILESSEHIDLLVTDVGLPGMNGRQLADIARQHRPELPVLFMTGYAEQAASSGFLEQGMDMISKPFSVDALAQHVRDMLAAAGTPSASATGHRRARNVRRQPGFTIEPVPCLTFTP